MRYVGYIRTSSEDQVGNFSIDAQIHAIETWVDEQQETIVKFYVDEGYSGQTTDRPEFLEMRRAAQKQEFDAIVVYKFDRFARNYIDSLAVKSLLRREYGIKVFSVSEASEDSDGEMGILFENAVEKYADWYSRNLSTETAKGKRERARQGYHNNRPPFGMDKTKEGILYPNEAELKGLLMAFELYATGDYSDNQIAKILNDSGYTSKSGSRFSTDTVRDIMQNRTYLGYIKYQPYQRNADGSRSYKADIEWFEGKHEAIIPKELFEKCQEVRANRATYHHTYYPKYRTYLLNDLVYCADCLASEPANMLDDKYARLRAYHDKNISYYRCRARDFGLNCSQETIRADIIDASVLKALKALQIPPDEQQKMRDMIFQILNDKGMNIKIAEISQTIERMDFRWDKGLFTDANLFLEQRAELQKELEKLQPIPSDTLHRAKDMVENFVHHLDSFAGDTKAQQEFLRTFFKRITIRGFEVVNVTLATGYQINLPH